MWYHNSFSEALLDITKIPFIQHFVKIHESPYQCMVEPIRCRAGPCAHEYFRYMRWLKCMLNRHVLGVQVACVTRTPIFQCDLIYHHPASLQIGLQYRQGLLMISRVFQTKIHRLFRVTTFITTEQGKNPENSGGFDTGTLRITPVGVVIAESTLIQLGLLRHPSK